MRLGFLSMLFGRPIQCVNYRAKQGANSYSFRHTGFFAIFAVDILNIALAVVFGYRNSPKFL